LSTSVASSYPLSGETVHCGEEPGAAVVGHESVPWPPLTEEAMLLEGLEKSAATVVSPLIVNVHGFVVPEQVPPDQPRKLWPLSAVAVRLTTWPETKSTVWPEQELSQLTAAGLLTTVPAPVRLTVRCTSVPMLSAS